MVRFFCRPVLGRGLILIVLPQHPQGLQQWFLVPPFSRSAFSVACFTNRTFLQFSTSPQPPRSCVIITKDDPFRPIAHCSHFLRPSCSACACTPPPTCLGILSVDEQTFPLYCPSRHFRCSTNRGPFDGVFYTFFSHAQDSGLPPPITEKNRRFARIPLLSRAIPLPL